MTPTTPTSGTPDLDLNRAAAELEAVKAQLVAEFESGRGSEGFRDGLGHAAELLHKRVAELRAATPASGEPPTLTLPDGWEQDDHIHWQQALYVSADGIELDSADLQPDDARSLAARLVEAAGIVEQLRAGAR